MPDVLGIEIGGTKLQLGIGGGAGTQLRAYRRLAARAAGGAAAIREQIQGALPAMLEQAALPQDRIAGVGVGFGGPVAADLATVTKSHQVDGWEEFPLAEWIEEQFGWRAIVHNDADTAALAETRFGAGKGYNPVFYITLGSGIGGGLVIDGKIYRGCGAGASEIGHMRVPDLGVPGNPWLTSREWWVTVESICSGWSIQRRAWEGRMHAVGELLEGRGSGTQLGEKGMTGHVGPSPADVADAAREGDARARQLIEETVRVLAVPVAQVITLLCPQRVVVGGGVSLMGEELLFEPLRREVAQLVFRPFAELYQIVPAALGEKVVLYGALALARAAFAE